MFRVRKARLMLRELCEFLLSKRLFDFRAKIEGFVFWVRVLETDRPQNSGGSSRRNKPVAINDSNAPPSSGRGEVRYLLSLITESTPPNEKSWKTQVQIPPSLYVRLQSMRQQGLTSFELAEFFKIDVKSRILQIREDFAAENPTLSLIYRETVELARIRYVVTLSKPQSDARITAKVETQGQKIPWRDTVQFDKSRESEVLEAVRKREFKAIDYLDIDANQKKLKVRQNEALKLTTEGSPLERKGTRDQTPQPEKRVQFVEYNAKQDSPVHKKSSSTLLSTLQVGNKVVTVYIQQDGQLLFQSHGLSDVQYQPTQETKNAQQLLATLDVQIIDDEIKVYGKEMENAALKIQQKYKFKKANNQTKEPVPIKKYVVDDGKRVIQAFADGDGLIFKSEGLQDVPYAGKPGVKPEELLQKLDIQFIDDEIKVYGKEMENAALKIQQKYKFKKANNLVKEPQPIKEFVVDNGKRVIQVFADGDGLIFKSKDLQEVQYAGKAGVKPEELLQKLDIQFIDDEIKVYGKEMENAALKIQQKYKFKKANNQVNEPIKTYRVDGAIIDAYYETAQNQLVFKSKDLSEVTYKLHKLDKVERVLKRLKVHVVVGEIKIYGREVFAAAFRIQRLFKARKARRLQQQLVKTYRVDGAIIDAYYETAQNQLVFKSKGLSEVTYKLHKLDKVERVLKRLKVHVVVGEIKIYGREVFAAAFRIQRLFKARKARRLQQQLVKTYRVDGAIIDAYYETAQNQLVFKSKGLSEVTYKLHKLDKVERVLKRLKVHVVVGEIKIYGREVFAAAFRIQRLFKARKAKRLQQQLVKTYRVDGAIIDAYYETAQNQLVFKSKGLSEVTYKLHKLDKVERVLKRLKVHVVVGEIKIYGREVFAAAFRIQRLFKARKARRLQQQLVKTYRVDEAIIDAYYETAQNQLVFKSKGLSEVTYKLHKLDKVERVLKRLKVHVVVGEIKIYGREVFAAAFRIQRLFKARKARRLQQQLVKTYRVDGAIIDAYYETAQNQLVFKSKGLSEVTYKLHKLDKLERVLKRIKVHVVVGEIKIYGREVFAAAFRIQRLFKARKARRLQQQLVKTYRVDGAIIDAYYETAQNQLVFKSKDLSEVTYKLDSLGNIEKYIDSIQVSVQNKKIIVKKNSPQLEADQKNNQKGPITQQESKIGKQNSLNIEYEERLQEAHYYLHQNIEHFIQTAYIEGLERAEDALELQQKENMQEVLCEFWKEGYLVQIVYDWNKKKLLIESAMLEGVEYESSASTPRDALISTAQALIKRVYINEGQILLEEEESNDEQQQKKSDNIELQRVNVWVRAPSARVRTGNSKQVVQVEAVLQVSSDPNECEVYILQDGQESDHLRLQRTAELEKNFENLISFNLKLDENNSVVFDDVHVIREMAQGKSNIKKLN